MKPNTRFTPSANSGPIPGISDNWETVKPAGAGDDIKLAYISWPTAYGQGAYTPEAIAYAESLGVEIVLSENIEPSPQADATTAILNAQAAGARLAPTLGLRFHQCRASCIESESSASLQHSLICCQRAHRPCRKARRK